MLEPRGPAFPVPGCLSAPHGLHDRVEMLGAGPTASANYPDAELVHEFRERGGHRRRLQRIH
ncbi:MAG TPA: hypothetical protein VIK41_15440, partial [Gemmatimonadaceae bacterium]